MSGHTLSDGAREVLAGARREAERAGAGAIGAEHLLIAALAAEPAAQGALARAGLDPAGVAERLAAGAKRGRPAGSAESAGEAVPLTSHARRLLEVASRIVRGDGAPLEPAHILIAGVSEPRGALARLLGDAGVQPAGVAGELSSAYGIPLPEPPAPAPREARGPDAGAPAEAKPAEPRGPAEAPPVPGPSASPPRERRRKPRNGGARPEDAQPAADPVRASERAEGKRGQARAERGERRTPEQQRAERRTPDAQRAERRGPGAQAGRAARREDAAGEPDARALEPRRPLPHLERAAARRRPGVRWKYALLLAVPVSIGLSLMHAPPLVQFVAACAAILPLAGLMGEATEQLAHRTGPTVGGLLNATFGNAAELIIALVALRAGQVDLVKASITGSILGNLLLILGLSLIAASRHSAEVRFNRTAAGMSSAMMALAVVGLVFPALFHATHPEGALRTELWLSEAVAVILVLGYAASLLFSLRTHKRLFGGDPHPLEGPVWGTGRAVALLAVATVGVAWESEILVHAVEPVTATLGLSTVFLGLIIIPIIGNAAEHAAAVVVARKGQTDLALQIALGSSTQIALLVAPLLVVAGVIFGQPGMNLVFTPFEVMALGLATFVTTIITLDGESHWFEGVQLLAVYGMIAVAAFFL